MASFSGVDGIAEAMNLYHSTSEKNAYITSGGRTATFGFAASAWITLEEDSGWEAGYNETLGGSLARDEVRGSFKREGDNYYWDITSGYDLAWDLNYQPFYSLLTMTDIYGYRWRYSGVNIAPLISILIGCWENYFTNHLVPWWTDYGWPQPKYQINDCGYFNNIAGYYFDFPSWAPVPDWYHFATLIKAGGETYGKEIAVTREAPGLPFNMEVWRKDPDPSEIYDYYPKQFLMDTNLLEELEDFPDISPSAELAEIGGGEVTPIMFYPWLTPVPTDQQFTPAQLEAATTDPETGELIFDCDCDLGDIMPDSIRLKEIHASLEAQRYGVNPDPEKPMLNNIGRLVEAIGYLLGVNLDPDGKNIPYPDPEYLTPEQVKEIAHLKASQFAAFDGAKGMQVASLYDIRANVPVKDAFGKTVIQPGGAVKTWNLAQFLDQMADDTETQLGGAALASLQVPAGDGKSYIQYEGLGHAIQDCLYMLSIESKRVDELVIQSARTIHLLQQVLMGLGLPLRPDTIDLLIGAETATAENPPKMGLAPVASLDPSGPTITSLLGITLANLSRLVAGTIGYQVTGVSAAADSGNEEIPDPFDFEEDLPGINL